jgi:hypothetical protein
MLSLFMKERSIPTREMRGLCLILIYFYVLVPYHDSTDMRPSCTSLTTQPALGSLIYVNLLSNKMGT